MVMSKANVFPSAQERDCKAMVKVMRSGASPLPGLESQFCLSQQELKCSFFLPGNKNNEKTKLLPCLKFFSGQITQPQWMGGWKWRRKMANPKVPNYNKKQSPQCLGERKMAVALHMTSPFFFFWLEVTFFTPMRWRTEFKPSEWFLIYADHNFDF